MPIGLDDPGVRFLRETQCGVVAREQLLDEDVTELDIQRMLRRRELAVVHPGVYVDHTGPLTWNQRTWAAVLACSPARAGQDRSRGAALCDESAVPGLSSSTIHVAIGLHRTVKAPAGVELHPTAHLDARVDWRACPPRMRTEHAVLDVMAKRIAGGDIAGAYAALATACFKATTVERVEKALAQRRRIGGRIVITGMLSDLRTGACSVLERGYLERVERAHGLPRADRQRPSTATGATTAQDVRYSAFGLVVEINGRFVHDNPQAWDADARRDLAELAVTDALTARVTYGLVFREACDTARWIARILRRRGWTGEFRRCPDCPVGAETV